MVMGENLDKEWVYLIVQAKQMGITKEEIRTFLGQESLIDVTHLEHTNNMSKK